MSSSPAPKPLPPLITCDPRYYYTIHVSGESFVLTQSAIEYDSPNFFTEVFLNPNREEYRTRAMYINRNPEVFRDIIKHLQGYYVAARDEVHLENLIMDAFFYKLNRLVEILRQTMFINVGGTLFKVSRQTVCQDMPNFFALLTPYADRNLTPTFFCRSPDLFRDILNHLQGYEIEIRDRVHRNNLLKEARYFKLNGLVQKLSLGTEYIYNGFPTNPEERTKPEVTMVLKNIKAKHVLVKGWRDFKEPSSRVRSMGFDGDFIFPPHPPTTSNSSFEGNEEGGANQNSDGASPNESGSLEAKEKILQFNKSLIESEALQDLLYRPTNDATCMSLVVELSSIELYAIWLESVHTNMLGDQHLFVYREEDLANLNKVCKHLGLKSLAIAANVVKLSPHIFFELDGQQVKGQEELKPAILKLALSSAQVVPPGRTLRIFLGRALVQMGCKSGELVMTIIKAEGWSSNKEYNASRKYLTEDTREFTL